jgi:hypothetical protein
MPAEIGYLVAEAANMPANQKTAASYEYMPGEIGIRRPRQRTCERQRWAAYMTTVLHMYKIARMHEISYLSKYPSFAWLMLEERNMCIRT